MERGNTGELEVDIGFRNEVKKAVVVSHDFFNAYYRVHVNTKFDSSHLYSLDKPVKRISNFGVSRKRINNWMKKARKQGNTYPDVFKRKEAKEIEAIKQRFKNATFVKKKYKDS